MLLSSVKNIFDTHRQRYLSRKRKSIQHIVIGKRCDKSSAAFLRYVSVSAGILNTVLDLITQFGKRIEYSDKRLAVVMVDQILYVFKQNNLRFNGIDYPCNLKEQIAPRVFETTLITHDGKTLTWETRNKNIAFWYNVCLYG